MKNKYGIAALTASILLLVLSSAIACSCPIVPFLAGIFAMVAVILTERIKRLVSALLVLASFTTAYIDFKNEGKLMDRAKDAVRRAEERARVETQKPAPETK